MLIWLTLRLSPPIEWCFRHTRMGWREDCLSSRLSSLISYPTDETWPCTRLSYVIPKQSHMTSRELMTAQRPAAIQSQTCRYGLCHTTQYYYSVCVCVRGLFLVCKECRIIPVATATFKESNPWGSSLKGGMVSKAVHTFSTPLWRP